MQTVGAPLTTVLQARDRDLIFLYELYATNYEPGGSGFDPRDADEVFSSVSFTLPFGPVICNRIVTQGPTIKKTTGKEFNTASIRTSNVKDNLDGFRYMAQFVLKNEVEQMRLVIRVVSRSVAQSIGNDISILSNSLVLFVGRCGKPDGFNRETGTISARPDMGTIEARIPPRLFQASCPLEFKGPECLGYEELGDKSAAYQAAVTCNKLLRGDCATYENEEFNQAYEFIQIESSFVHKSNESFFKKILNIFPGISRKITTVNNSLYDGTPYGNPIPLIFGRWYKTLLPLQYQDIGTSINFLMAACRGKIADFINIRTLSLNFTPPIGVTKHLGEFGGDGSQTQDTVFPQHGFFSRLAYITGYCNGSDIESPDPAPEISAVIAGIIPDQIYFDVDHDGTGKLSAGTGGVTAAGSSVLNPGTPAASLDAFVLSKSTKGYWKEHETDAPPPTPNTSLTDGSGENNHGSLIPNAEAGLVQGITGPTTTEVSCFAMGGGIARIPPTGDTAAPLRPTGTKLTIAFWVRKSSSGGTVQTIISHGGATVNSYVAIGQRSTGNFPNNIVFSLELEDGDYLLVSQSSLPDDVFVRGVCVRDGSLMWISLNGCIDAVRTDLPADSNIQMQDAPFRLGYMINIAFGAVNQSGGQCHVSVHPDFAYSAQDASDDYASAVLDPLGCPGEDWTDNPVDHARWVLTEPSLMGNDDDSIDDIQSAYAAAWNCGAIKDDTNAERCLLPNTETAKAGVDYKRYNSTGLLTPESFETTRTQIPAGVPAHECDYEFFDPAAAPTALNTVIVYRKRSTCNLEIAEQMKAVDFLYDKLFPTFNGFLRWNTKGQTVIDSHRPADWTKLRSASIVGATTLTVQDVLPWKNVLGSPYLLHGKVHISVQPTWTYFDAVQRTNATDFTAGDVGKFARQIDGNTLWKLTAVTPTWIEVQDLSEVRSVTLAQYSSLGDAITLAASASGGPSAVASSANLTGGSTTVQSSGTVTITGSLAEDATITVTIDGTACVLTLLTGESSSIIGHRMACVINATPEINEYVEAHAVNNVVTIKAKVGVLTLSSALVEAHAVYEEVTRVMASYAGKALAYADTTRANILDGTFEWPNASRQSLVNQIKAEYREAVRDFGKQPIVVNDYNHQRKTRKVNTFEVDHSAIDSYHQSARLANGLLNKLRDGDKFFGWASMGESLLLDEGDVVCVSDDSGPFRNQLVRIEDIGINNDLKVSFEARKYSRHQLSDLVAEPAGILLPSALTNFEQPPPDIAFNEEDFPPDGLTQSTDGTAGITSIRGGLVYGASIYAQWAKVRLIKRASVTVDESINDHLVPNANLKGTFEFIASADGLYTVQAQSCNQWGCSAVVTADIVIGFGSLFAIAKEGGILFLKEGGNIVEKEHA